MDAPLTRSLIREFQALVDPKRCLSTPEDCTAYSYDMFARGLPDLVLLPESTEEVSRIMALAHEHRIPVTPRGAGTSLTGGPVATKGGIVLSLTRMNQILEISRDNRLVRAQAGVVTADLQKAVAAQGLFYPPNPTSAEYCTLGGNIATNAGGASGVKYGVTRDYILSLTAVLADGRILKTGNPCIKSVTGFDFRHALCGSEGLLAVITEASLRLIPAPRQIKTSLAYFKDIPAAARAVAAIIQDGLVPSTMELMDDGFLAAVSRVYGLEFPPGAGAALLLELDGEAETLAAQGQRLEEICTGQAAITFEQARTEEERQTLWQARRGGTAALVRNAKFLQTLDFAVPVAAMAQAVQGIQEITTAHGLTMVLIGHAGDGNLHPMFIYDPENPKQKAAFQAAEKEMSHLILSMDGTLSGEHGIGLEKAEFLPHELSTVELDLGRELKKTMDPRSILNPGKCGF